MTHFALGSPVTRDAIPALCAELAGMLRGAPGGVVTCDVAAVARPDVATVEALARLRLTAGRHGRRLVVRGAGPVLLDLVRLVGLTDLLEVSGQSEEREQARSVEEVVDGRDPPV